MNSTVIYVFQIHGIQVFPSETLYNLMDELGPEEVADFVSLR